MLILLIAIIGFSLLISGGEDSAFQEYCRLECWEEKRPCCRTA